MPALFKTVFAWIFSDVGKMIALRVLRGEAEAYLARAKQTPGEEDDARAKTILDVVSWMERG